MMHIRKITQIAYSICDSKHCLYALCDDGSLWIQTVSGWKAIEDIPQPGDEE